MYATARRILRKTPVAPRLKKLAYRSYGDLPWVCRHGELIKGASFDSYEPGGLVLTTVYYCSDKACDQKVLEEPPVTDRGGGCRSASLLKPWSKATP